jgi:hypothetical protein
MLFIHRALKGNALPIPIWRFEADQKPWRFYRAADVLELSDVRPSNVMVERTLKIDLFSGLQSWPPNLITTPDILIYRKDSRRLVIIENKTKGTGTGSIREYWKAAQYLKKCGWEADLLVLISCGHPNDSIWNVVKELQLKLLLWEDLLKIADSMDWSKSLFEEDLREYYEQPLLQGEWGRSEAGRS